MAHQRNQHRTVSSARAHGQRGRLAGDAQSAAQARRFELFDPDAPPPPPKETSRAPLLVIPLVVVALLVVAFARSLIVRTLLPLALAAAAIWILALRARREKASERERTSTRGLLLRYADLRFKPGSGDLARTVLDRACPFGATLLSTHRRDRLVLMLTSGNSVFHVGTIVEATPVLDGLLARATTVAGEDAAFEAIGPDGQPVLLAAHDFVAFVHALEEDDPGCLDRVVVTDTRGAPVVLDGGELRVDSFAFDLNEPLEWRALVFQEPFGQVMTLYQGTWIRQGGSEVVLVSLLPSLGPILEVEPGEIATLDRAVLRDLRLMQASAEKPPPREQRHAIERLLMMPIRSSLDRAPRKSRQPMPPRPPLH